MRWLLDQGLPRSAATFLWETGEDALHVGDLGMADASDDRILDHARRDGRIVVTLDADFHSLLAVGGAARPSVIRLREEGMKGQVLAKLILDISRQFKSELMQGCAMSYQNGKIRLRKLPICGT